DFPVMNSNQDAMMMIGLYRVCGIEPSMQGDGLDIMPKAPPERYILDTQLLRLEVDTGRVGGVYCPSCKEGQCTLHVHIPDGASNVTATIDDIPIKNLAGNEKRIDLPLIFQEGEEIRFQAKWD